jgi:hypothetical protein
VFSQHRSSLSDGRECKPQRDKPALWLSLEIVVLFSPLEMSRHRFDVDQYQMCHVRVPSSRFLLTLVVSSAPVPYLSLVHTQLCDVISSLSLGHATLASSPRPAHGRTLVITCVKPARGVPACSEVHHAVLPFVASA